MLSRRRLPTLFRAGLWSPLVLTGPLLLCAVWSGEPAARAEKPRRVSIGAIGYQFTQLGVRIGYEQAFWVRGVSEFFFAAAVGGHAGPDPGYSLLTQFELGYRATSDSKRAAVFFDSRLGIGYSPWFRSQGRGDVETVISVLTPTALAGVGLDFGRHVGTGLSLFALAGGMGRYDFQSTFSVAGLMLLGLQYQFGAPKKVAATLPIPAVPPAEAPVYPDDPSVGPSPLPPGPAEPAPVEPAAPGPAVLPPPTRPADVPQLPPPPTLPYSPQPSGA